MTRRDLLVTGLSLAALPTRVLSAQTPQTSSRWWMTEPIRLLQTNLRETDSTLDPARLIEQVAAFPANALLFNMGGIVAQYPTRAPFHYASPYLPPGRDLFGDVLTDAHARRIRVIGRFDFSKTQKAVFDAHPEWFFTRTTGEPAIYNGLYSTCINSEWYRAHALVILTEALERYDVDGLFFNMFGNPSTDYSGDAMGPCQCGACQMRFHARYGRALPAKTGGDEQYAEFLTDSAHEVAALFADTIHRLRPRAAFLTYVQAHTDLIVSESNTGVDRALPLWPYSASDNVNRARTTEPEKMALNLCMSFVDFPWRFVTVPPAEIQMRLYQNLAHGGPPAMAMLGTMDQEDRQALIAARPVFDWHSRHEDLYVGQRNAARVLLMRGQSSSYRGFFRLLSEQHVPFAVTDTLPDPSRTWDLVIAPSGAPAELEAYVRAGGRLLVAGLTPPSTMLPANSVVGRRPRIRGSWRIHDRAWLPSLKDTDLLLLDGEYVELSPLDTPLLTLIPPAMFGPPEKVWVDKKETTVPGLIVAKHGQGEMAYVPWDVGGLYYRHSSHGHAGLMIDVIDRLLPRGRHLKTNAHPLVEITVMEQPARGRTLIHLVNMSGHADTAYFAPIELRDLTIEIAQPFAQVTAMRANQRLPVTRSANATRFTLPALHAYDVLVANP